MLDHIVAGGQPHGISVVENVRKECEEEASIPLALAQQCVPPHPAPTDLCCTAVLVKGLNSIGPVGTV